jgi:hypothetical protein
MKRNFCIISALIASALCLSGRANGDDHWIPDAATVALVESYAKTHMPVRDSSDKAKPLASYARYYTGMTLKGRKIVFGEYVAFSGHSVGVHIVPWDKMPGISDGGCGVVDLWYDVALARMVQIECHGVA